MDHNRSQNCFFEALLDDETVPDSQYTSIAGHSLSSRHEIGPTQDKVKRLGNFTIEEDLALISASLNTSMNPSVGTDQKAKTFWSKVASNFYENSHRVSKERIEHSLVNRYGEIQKAVNKFIGIVTQVENSRPSGYNEQDKIQKAKAMYREVYNSNFKFEHCWNILRHQPKWLETNGVARRRRQNITYLPLTPTSGNIDEDSTHSTSFIDLERPLGKKAEKAKQNKRKKMGVEESSDYVDWKVEKLKMHEQKMKIEEQKLILAMQELETQREYEKARIEAEKARAEAEERRMKLKERQEEMKIMMMDLNSLSEEGKRYIQMHRAEILEKGRNM